MRLIWPSITFGQVGESASSKSAMNTLAPEFSALMTILREVGPVISTRRSSRSSGMGATFQSPSRMALVSGKKSGSPPASHAAWRSARAWSRRWRCASNRRAMAATNSSASGGEHALIAGFQGACNLNAAGKGERNCFRHRYLRLSLDCIAHRNDSIPGAVHALSVVGGKIVVGRGRTQPEIPPQPFAIESARKSLAAPARFPVIEQRHMWQHAMRHC